MAALQHHEVDAGEYKWYIDILPLKQLNTMGPGWGIGAAEIALSALSKRVSLDPRLFSIHWQIYRCYDRGLDVQTPCTN